MPPRSSRAASKTLTLSLSLPSSLPSFLPPSLVYLDETKSIDKNSTVLVKRVAAPRGSVGLLARLKANTPLTPQNMYVWRRRERGREGGREGRIIICVVSRGGGREGGRVE